VADGGVRRRRRGAVGDDERQRMIDPRTPVLVGVGQAQQRVEDLTTAREPIDLLADAARLADADAGGRRSLLGSVDTVATAAMVSWPYPDPGALLARRIGATDLRRSVVSTNGGNSPQMLMNALASDIADGACDVALVGGAECLFTRLRARKEPKTWLTWTDDDAAPCPEVIGDARAGTNDYEDDHGANAPIIIYPLFETALRHAAGRTFAEHQRHLSELWAGFNAVAVDNPHAWSPTPRTAEEIRTVGPGNRMIVAPYPKLLCANIEVDQAAALLVGSYEAASAAGVPDDRMVFLLAGADAHDHHWFSEREHLAEAPAVGFAARAALGVAGIDLDDVARFDLYSCFPSAVQLTMGALGLVGPAGSDERPLTVTGGLGFAGGPANNYPAHSIARMVEACRADAGSIGLVHALGWYATKHSVGLYSTRPPEGHRFALADRATTQATVDALPSRAAAGPYEGSATIEATAVHFGRDGTPDSGVVALLGPTGARVLAGTADRDVLSEMAGEGFEGRPATVTTDGRRNTVEP